MFCVLLGKRVGEWGLTRRSPTSIGANIGSRDRMSPHISCWVVTLELMGDKHNRARKVEVRAHTEHRKDMLRLTV